MEVARGSDSPAEIRGDEERKTVSPAVSPAEKILARKKGLPIPPHSNSFHIPGLPEIKPFIFAALYSLRLTIEVFSIRGLTFTPTARLA